MPISQNQTVFIPGAKSRAIGWYCKNVKIVEWLKSKKNSSEK